MGDNVYLGDRDGVRTPMQWTGDRNGGFSRADFAQLYLPPLMDPVYGFQAVNVEAQLRTPTSLLRWLHRFIALRKEHPVFGLGTYEPLRPENPRIFAHVRRYEDDIVLCVHNLARSAQAVELDLSRVRRAACPEEMLGRTRFPRIGELPYLLTLAPRGFFWFQLRRTTSDDADRSTSDDARSSYVDRAQRWFGAKSREVARRAGRSTPRRAAGEPPLLALALVEVRFGPGTHDLYQLLARPGGRRSSTGSPRPTAVAATSSSSAIARRTLELHAARTASLEFSAEATIDFRRRGELPASSATVAADRRRAVEHARSSSTTS